MGIFINLEVTKSVIREEWKKVYVVDIYCRDQEDK